MANVKHFFSTLSNPFLKIAGIQALLWGIAGIIISIAMSIIAPGPDPLSRTTAFRSGLEQCMVVLCRRTYNYMVNSFHIILCSRQVTFSLTHQRYRRIRNNCFRSTTFYIDEFIFLSRISSETNEYSDYCHT